MQTNRGDSLKKFFYDYVRIAEKIVHAERNDQLFGFVFSIFFSFRFDERVRRKNSLVDKESWIFDRVGTLFENLGSRITRATP